MVPHRETLFLLRVFGALHGVWWWWSDGVVRNVLGRMAGAPCASSMRKGIWAGGKRRGVVLN